MDLTSVIEQRDLALKRANEVRSAIKEVKLLVATGTLTLAQALVDERAGSMAVERLLRCTPRIGPRRARCILSKARIPEAKRVVDLTERQRQLIADQVNGRPLGSMPNRWKESGR